MSLLIEAVAALRAGELVAIPTETVYGLAADATNPRAVAQIFELKGRPPTRPLILHVGSGEQLTDWARDIPDYAIAMAQAFWPGPLALVLPRNKRVSDVVTGGQDTVAIRVPDHPLTLELLREFGGAVAAPSANRYGRISPTRADHVRSEFGARAPLILDGGVCHVGIESTIVSCLGDKPRILRHGVFSADTITRAAGVGLDQGSGEQPLVAGQDRSHYAPTTPVSFIPYQTTQLPIDRDVALGFLGFSEPPCSVAVERRLPLRPDAAARALYASLRDLDESAAERLLIEAPPAGADWEGIRDRLQRAAAASEA